MRSAVARKRCPASRCCTRRQTFGQIRAPYSAKAGSAEALHGVRVVSAPVARFGVGASGQFAFSMLSSYPSGGRGGESGENIRSLNRRGEGNAR